MSYSPIAKTLFQQAMYDCDPNQYKSLEEDRQIVQHLNEQEKLYKKGIEAKSVNVERKEIEIEKMEKLAREEQQKFNEYWKGSLICNEELDKYILED